MHLDRIKSNHSDNQSNSKSTLDVVKRTFIGCRSRYPEKLKENITEYEKEYESCESKLANIQHDIEFSRFQLARFKEQGKKHEAIFKESQQVLDEYDKLFSDPQRYQEELNKIDAKVAVLQAELHGVQQQIGNLTEGRDKHRDNIQKENLMDLIAKQRSLREQMQRELITPIDKLYIQYEKYLTACQNMDETYEKISMKDSPGITPGAQESSTTSLSEIVAEITQLRDKVQQTQTEVGSGSWYSSKSHKKVNALVETVQKLHEDATDTEGELEEHRKDVLGYAKELFKKLMAPRDCEDQLRSRIYSSGNYSPYYSMDRVLSEQSADIDSMLPGSCGIKTTRRGLSKLGIDIKENATEEKIAQLVEYLERRRGRTWASNIQKAYRHYGFGYIHINPNTEKVVTIEEIDHITKQGYVVNVVVSKPEIGKHALLIEEVTRTENGYHVTFYDPFNNKRVTLPYKELEKVLTGHYTLPSEEQMETRKPILKVQAEAKAKTKMLWSVLDSPGAYSTDRSQVEPLWL